MRSYTIKFVLVVFTLVLLTGFAAPYTGEGGALPESSCNDGIDNDGDGDIDLNDSACTQPLYETDNEYSLWDTHITGVMEEDQSLTGDLPADTEGKFFSTEIRKDNTGNVLIQDSTNLDDSISQTFVERSFNSGGNITEETAKEKVFSPSETGTLILSDGRIVNPPNPAGISYQTVIGSPITCGDGERTTQDAAPGDRNIDCPDDWGLADQIGNTESSLSTSISGRAGTYSTDTGDSGDETTDDVRYKMDLVAPEHNTDVTRDISGSTPDSILFEDENWEKAPDFYTSGDSIRMVYPEVDSNEFIRAVEDTDLTSDTYTHYSDSGYDTETSCSPKDENATCEPTGDVCTDDSVNHVQDRTLDSDPVTFEVNTQEHTTEKDSGGYNSPTSPQTFEVTVERDISTGSDQWVERDAHNCGEWKTTYSCNTTGGCDFSSSDVYTKNIENYNDGFESKFTNFYYEDIDIKDTIIFHLNENLNPPEHDVVDPKDALFGGTDYNTNNIVSSPFNGNDYWVHTPSEDSGEIGNQRSASTSGFTIETDGNIFESSRDFYQTVDADGRYGFGDGFVVIDEGAGGIVATMNPEGNDNVGDMWVRNGKSGGSTVSALSKVGGTCQGQDVVCLKYADFYVNDASTDDPTGSIGVDVQEFKAGRYSVCKSIKWMANQTGGGIDIKCDYDSNDGSSVGPGPQVCGDQPWEEWREMKGPEVNEGSIKPAHQQACLDMRKYSGDPCVLWGEGVPEGTEVDVNHPDEDPYEAGTVTTDQEVCWKGEWWDKDGAGDIPVLSKRWTNHNPPYHPTHNPKGNKSGTALEDNCGNNRFDNLRCDDSTTSYSHYYSVFVNGAGDDDSSVFEGVVNRLNEDSNQLEPGMDTDNYGMPDASDSSTVSVFFDTRGGDNADEWAISRSLRWVVDSTGVPYPPYGTYYRNEMLGTANRTDMSDPDIEKVKKAFGNSYAAVDSGEGIWIDPDDMKDASSGYSMTPDGAGWREAFRRHAPKMDLTGIDSGIGFDLEGGGESSTNKGYVDEIVEGSGTYAIDTVFADIYWERSSSSIDPSLEPSVCGDDESEYLLEEMGESSNPEQYDGRYACVSDRDSCVSFNEDGEVVYDEGDYTNAGEKGETEGRLKNDDEVCVNNDVVEQPVWYDQDFGDIDGDGVQDTCNTNYLYGSDGVRWIDSQYVKDYPKAVTGGIDDDWNQHIENNYPSSDYPDKYTSEPDKDSWNFDSESPVPDGGPSSGDDSIATLGFCGGDDDGEYLVTQQCSTSLCETDRRIMGVAKTPGSCVLEPDTLNSGYSTSLNERKLFEPGDEVEIDVGSETRQIACFGGYWFEDWPVGFNQKVTEVPLGTSTTTGFQIINVRNEQVTFDVEMIEPANSPSGYQYSEFVGKNGDRFNVTVPPKSSKQFDVSIRGGTTDIDGSEPEHDLRIRAEAIDADISGEDYTTVKVVENSAINGSITQTQPMNVPGIGPIHLMALILLSSLIVFFQS